MSGIDVIHHTWGPLFLDTMEGNGRNPRVHRAFRLVIPADVTRLTRKKGSINSDTTLLHRISR